MHIHCPNCKASFTIESGKLPSPKFNSSLQSYGWKFECGQCDTQWWVCLTPTSADQITSPHFSNKKQSNPSPLLQDLISLNSSNTYSGMNELLTIPTPKRNSQPITFPSEDFFIETPRLQDFHDNKPSRLRYERLNPKKKNFFFLKLISFILLLFIFLLTFEFFYPKKINTIFKQAFSTITQMINTPKTIQNNNSRFSSSSNTIPNSIPPTSQTIQQNSISPQNSITPPVIPLPN